MIKLQSVSILNSDKSGLKLDLEGGQFDFDAKSIKFQYPILNIDKVEIFIINGKAFMTTINNVEKRVGYKLFGDS